MLNIAKLAPGGEDYYLTTVASNVEDYYTGRGEAPGRWMGRGAHAMELHGVVAPVALRTVLGGRDPRSDEELLAQTQRKVPGFDLTFRAPKSVSLLWALGSKEVEREVREAHDHAVAASLDYLERNAAFTRRGKGGRERVHAEGLIAAGFRHRTSRADDPLLHTHVLVANMARTADDGVWRTLDGRQLYVHAKTAGYLYQAQLRTELSRRLGVEWTPVTNGYADIDGVPREAIEAFSRRRSQILAQLEEVGGSSAKAAQIATLKTRPAKSHTDQQTLRDRWRQRAPEVGLAPQQVAGLVGRTVAEPPDKTRLRSMAAGLLGPAGLTAQASTFSRREAIQGWCQQLRDGDDVTQVERLADRLLSADFGRTVRLTRTAELASTVGGSHIRLGDGRVVPAAPDEARYSTPELLAIEQRLVDGAVARRGEGAAIVDPDLARDTLAAHGPLSDEQMQAVLQLTSSGDGVEVLVGRAGAGKTYALGAARAVWEAAGVRTYGCAVAARTARGLNAGSGITSVTVTKLLADLDLDHGSLAPGSVLVVDEAGMVGTRCLDQILDRAATAGAKVVLVGDHHQLPEIDAGGAFRGLVNRLPAIELNENRRQTEAWERDALDQVRNGDIHEAVEALNEHDRIVVNDTIEAVHEQLVGDWWNAVAEHDADAIMVAARHRDLDDLNARARLRMGAAGRLSGRALEARGRPFQVGDRVLCLRNRRSLGVLNGTRGTVTTIDHERRELTLTRDDTGETVRLSASYVDEGWLDHGYALTAHKAQGLTCDATFVLASDEIYREWGYVALSRGRHTNRLYLVGQPDPDPPDDASHPSTLLHDDRPPAQRLAADLRRSHQQSLALEHLDTSAGTAEVDTSAGKGACSDAIVQRLLGPAPVDQQLQAARQAAAQAIERYRREHGVDDDTRPLGPPPTDLQQRRAYQQVLRQLLDTRRQLRHHDRPAHQPRPVASHDLA